MNSLEVVNIIIYIASFFIFFSALIMDFSDRNSGSIVRRTVFVICMLLTCSFMIKATEAKPDGLTLFWLVLSLVMLMSKVIQYKGKTKHIDSKISHFVHSIGKSSGQKQSAH